VADLPEPSIDFESLRRRLDEAEARLAGEEARGEGRREVLAARARVIAGAREAPRVERVAVVAFAIGGERYAVEVGAVSQVLEVRALHPLIGAPPQVLGAIVARTRVVPVIDLRQVLGLQGGGMSDLGTVVVVDHGGAVFGIAAEAVEGRLEVPREGLAPPAGGGPFTWVAPDRLALLDLGRVLAGPGKG
jgi:purine-binding chemotaxis protein CheW